MDYSNPIEFRNVVQGNIRYNIIRAFDFCRAVNANFGFFLWEKFGIGGIDI